VFKDTSFLLSNMVYTDMNVLKIYVDNNNLKSWYIDRANKHNSALKNNQFPDSGFDLAIPTDLNVQAGFNSTKVDLGIKCVMTSINSSLPSSPYYIYPRSSISKTPLHLANNVGIIDCGYRGNLIVMLRNFSKDDYSLMKNDRIVQICHQTLLPFSVEIVDNEDDLGKTERMGKGLGSTGK